MSDKSDVSRELSDELAALFTKGFLDDRMVSAIVEIVSGHTRLDTTPGSTLKVMRGPGGGLYLSGVEDLREGDVFRREVRK